MIKKVEKEEKPLAKGHSGKEPVIEVEHLFKSFGEKVVLKDFNLIVNKGESMVVMGKSGIGKTVLIKCIIKLLKPDSGTLTVFGKDISKLSQLEMDQLRMNIGFVFQNSALYDSMTIRENLEFPLRRQLIKKIKGDLDKLVREALKNVGLENTIDMMPGELSGGMRKRIGIARSLILQPEIVLYDEPTTGLDPITSKEIINLIMDLQKKFHTTSIIITHDIALARDASDQIVFLIDGIAYLQGTYNELAGTTDPKVKPFFD
jgi:phospholipid/cholesterol/gamma-HCH transport system ATP-binding protein